MGCDEVQLFFLCHTFVMTVEKTERSNMSTDSHHHHGFLPTVTQASHKCHFFLVLLSIVFTS